MRKIICKRVLTIILTSLLLTGCGTPEVTKQLPEKTPATENVEQIKEAETKDSKIDPNQAPMQGITVNQISFAVVDEASLSEQIRTEIESLKLVRGYMYWLQDDGSYLIFISSGEKTTGGYGIEVTSIEDNEGKTNISVVETSPAEDAMMIQVISYPYVVIQASQITDQFYIYNQEQVPYDLILLDKETIENSNLDGLGDARLAFEESPLNFNGDNQGIYQGQVDPHSIELLVGDSYVVLNADDIVQYLDGIEPGDTVSFKVSISPNDQLMLDSIVEIQ